MSYRASECNTNIKLEVNEDAKRLDVSLSQSFWETISHFHNPSQLQVWYPPKIGVITGISRRAQYSQLPSSISLSAPCLIELVLRSPPFVLLAVQTVLAARWGFLFIVLARSSVLRWAQIFRIPFFLVFRCTEQLEEPSWMGNIPLKNCQLLFPVLL